MTGKLGIWAVVSFVIVGALLFGAVANAGAVKPPVTTYKFTVTEVGLPSGTSWDATLNGVVSPTTTTTSISFTGVSAGSFYLYTEDPIAGSGGHTQYVAYNSYTYVTVPNELRIAMPYVTQDYVTVAITPASSGSTSPTSGWVNTGTNVSISGAAAAGYSFQKWTVSSSTSLVLSSTTLEATQMHVANYGTLTAHFLSTKYSGSFIETGLPSGQSWTVIFNTVGVVGTGSTISSTGHVAGNYGWSISPIMIGTTKEYVPYPASGSMNIPYQVSQEIVFTTEYSETIAASPSGSGSVSPSGVGYYANNSNFPVVAYNSGSWVFSKWSANETRVGLGSTKDAGTNATVKAFSGTITADFVSGTPCTTCTLTFRELGLPTGTSWGVSFAGLYYTSSSSSVTVTGITGSNSWGAFDPVGAGQVGVAYYAVGTSSGYWYLGSTNSIEIVYEKYAYVTVSGNPYFSGGGVTASSQWFPDNQVTPISAINSATYKFATWSASSSNLTLGSSTNPSTTMMVTGPGTLTVNFVAPTSTIHFAEYGLAAGKTWGISLGGVSYFSSTGWLNLTGMSYGSISWSVYNSFFGVTGVEWQATATSGSMVAPGQTYAAIVFAEVIQVTFATAGTNIGSIYPAGTTYYWWGTVVPLIAENATATTGFSGWTQTSGTATIASTSSAGTSALLKGPGTITGTFH